MLGGGSEDLGGLKSGKEGEKLESVFIMFLEDYGVKGMIGRARCFWCKVAMFEIFNDTWNNYTIRNCIVRHCDVNNIRVSLHVMSDD